MNFLKKILGKELYCRMFHTAYGKNDKWYCEKCNITYDKKIGDSNTGPK